MLYGNLAKEGSCCKNYRKRRIEILQEKQKFLMVNMMQMMVFEMEKWKKEM